VVVFDLPDPEAVQNPDDEGLIDHRDRVTARRQNRGCNGLPHVTAPAPKKLLDAAPDMFENVR
jgi:hypothetical protein